MNRLYAMKVFGWWFGLDGHLVSGPFHKIWDLACSLVKCWKQVTTQCFCFLIAVDFSQFVFCVFVVFVFVCFFAASCLVPPAVYSMFCLPTLLRLCARLCCSAGHHLKVLPSINNRHSWLFFYASMWIQITSVLWLVYLKFPTLGQSNLLYSVY